MSNRTKYIATPLICMILAACGGVGSYVAPAGGGGSSGSGYTLGGDVSGLVGGAQLVLQNSDSTSTTISADGPFTFDSVQSGTSYAVTVVTQPAAQACTVTNGSGTVTNANITNISVHCVASAESVLYYFGTNAADGTGPSSNLVSDSFGNLYGTNGPSGSNNQGTVYQLSPTGTETILYTFQGGTDGANPTALIMGKDGNFYGVTQLGGANGQGTLFEVTPSGTETILYSFGASASDAATPISLIQGSDGNFYGVASYGGANGVGVCVVPNGSSCDGYGYGALFKVDSTGHESLIYSFGQSAANGYSPNGIIQGGDGKFYGTTAFGGTHGISSSYCQNGISSPCISGYGTVFQITAAGIETILYNFGATANDGFQPIGQVIFGVKGNIYGVTALGGANVNTSNLNGQGTLFELTSSGESVLYSFGASTTDGQFPAGSIVQGNDGNFYGTTQSGGAYSTLINSVPNSNGILFKVTASGTETVLYSFGAYTNDLVFPLDIIFGNNGSIYGTAASYGASTSSTFNAGGVFVFGAN